MPGCNLDGTMKSLAPSGEDDVKIGVVISKNPLSVILLLKEATTFALKTIFFLTSGFLKSKKRYFNLVSSLDDVDVETSNGNCS